jgi:hypothetical protein
LLRGLELAAVIVPEGSHHLRVTTGVRVMRERRADTGMVDSFDTTRSSEAQR